jgi:hypothetical protein
MSRIFSSAEPGPQLTWTAMSCLGISPRFFRLISRGLKCPLRKIRGHLDPHRDFESRFCPETPAVDLVLMHYFVK